MKQTKKTPKKRLVKKGEVRARKIKLQKNKFLAVLRDGAYVKDAILAAGCCRATIYKWRDDDVAFHRNWEDADEVGIDCMAEEAVRRGMESSDVLLMFMLKAKRPNIYREQRGSGKDEGFSNIHNINILSLSDEQLRDFATRIDGELGKVARIIKAQNKPRTITQAPRGN